MSWALDVSGAGCPLVLDVPGCWMSQGAGCLGCYKKIPKLVKFYSSKNFLGAGCPKSAGCWMSWVLDVSGAGCPLVLDVSGCWMSRVLDVRVLDVQMLDVPVLDVCESRI